jgi:hypothetical protein
MLRDGVDDVDDGLVRGQGHCWDQTNTGSVLYAPDYL